LLTITIHDGLEMLAVVRAVGVGNYFANEFVGLIHIRRELVTSPEFQKYLD